MIRKIFSSLIMVTVISLFVFVILPYSLWSQNYFFIGDEDFTVEDWSHSMWKKHFWNPSPDAFVTISNGILDLFFNETTGEDWSNSKVIQGRFPHGDPVLHHLPILVGKWGEKETTDFCLFMKNHGLPKSKFWLETKLKYVQRNFEHEIVDEFKSDVPKGNVGIDLMFALNDLDYDETPFQQQCMVHVDVIFAGFRYENGEWVEIPRGTIWVFDHSLLGHAFYDYDLHVSYHIDTWKNEGEWMVIQYDLGKIITELYDLLKPYCQVNKLRCYGFQVYADGIGTSSQVQFDYIRTVVK